MIRAVDAPRRTVSMARSLSLSLSLSLLLSSMLILSLYQDRVFLSLMEKIKKGKCEAGSRIDCDNDCKGQSAQVCTGVQFVQVYSV